MNNHVKIYGVKPRIQYVADGVSQSYEFPFAIFNSSDVNVYFDDVLQEKNLYVVSKAQNSAGGNVRFESVPSTGTVITIIRNLSIERISDFQEGSVLRADVLNDELDYQIACQQQIAENLNRTMVLPPYAIDNDLNLTLPTPQAGKAIVWNSDGTNLENSTVKVNALESTLKEYKNQAQTAAQNAKNDAQIALENADIATQKAQETVQTLSQRATISMDNLSSDGKKVIASMAMPSSIGTTLTFGASGTEYVAPANGWFCVFANGISGSNISISLQNISSPLQILGMEKTFYDYWGSARIFCSAKKGDVVKLIYNGSYNTTFVHFISAVGG